MNRYRNIQVGKTPKGNRYIKNPIYPSIEETLDDIYVETEYGDRVDVLAYQFYNDASLWWIITTANPGKLRRDSYVCQAGLQIRIPHSKQVALDLYNNLNRVR